ncbi:MAG: hypothetical protein B6D58_07390 [candidate division Zixibacteria bacterium 4484_95]|nr:MAG: hypothetical protein B6D58_07390 [candidate division Zixibacteria bacterium 4484_95]
MLFERYADDYARYRPCYPHKVLLSLRQRFDLHEGKVTLDLACGTGILGRQIYNLTKSRVFGVDPSRVLLKHCFSIKAVCGTAEAIPFKTGSFDVVLIGQALHWFDLGLALKEIKRVTKPAGGLAVLWYRRKRPLSGHQLKFEKLVFKFNPSYKPDFMDYDWLTIIAKEGGFSDIIYNETDCVLKYSVDDYLKLQRSKSYIGDALSLGDLKHFMREGKTVLENEYPDGVVKERMTFRYVWATRVS